MIGTMHFRAKMFYAFLAVAGSLLAQPAGFVDHGTLKVMAGGQVIGTERFDIEPAGEGFRMRAEARLKMPNGADANESTVMNLGKDLSLMSYTRLQKTPKKASAQVDFVSGHAKAHYITPEGATDYEFYVEPTVVILDTNFFHHFALLIQRYDLVKGGLQHIHVLIPQEASPGMMTLEYNGKEEGHDKWTAKTDAVEMIIWSDGGKLFKLSAPAAKVEIVRDTKN